VVLLGRDEELAALNAAIERASQGRRGIVIVEGEAGIGKSAVVAEAVSTLVHPCHVFHGTADRLGRGLPFGLLASTLGVTPDVRQGPFAELTPVLFGNDSDTGTSRFLTIETALDIVERLAEERVVLLVLEDVHWADEASLAFIERSLRRSQFLRICLIITARSEPRSPELALLLEALADAKATMLAPEPLSDALARDLARRLLRGRNPGANLGRHLARAGGNPLFITELVNALEQSGLLTDEGDVVEAMTTGLPGSLRATILRRLAALGDPVVSLLKRAAVLGRRFSLTDLAAVANVEPTEALEWIDVARRAAVIHDDGDHLVFRHDVIRDALYDEIPQSARRALHMQVADVLAARKADAIEVGEHIVRGIRHGDLEAVSRLRTAAARLRDTAPRDALRLLDLAIEVVPDHPERHAMETELAEACMWAGQPQRAEQLARGALVNADLRHLASVTLMRAVVQQNDPAHTVATIDEILSGGAGGAEGRVEAEAGQGLSTSREHHERARGAAHRALQLAGDADPTVTAVAEMTLGYLANYYGYLDEATRRTAKALEAAMRDPTDEALRRGPHLAHGFHLNLSGRHVEAEQVLHAGVVIAQRLGTEWIIPSYHGLAGVIYGLQGRWDDAETELVAGIGLAKELGVGVSLVNMYMFLAELLVERGRLDQARALLSDAGQDLPLDEAVKLPSPFARWGGARWLDEIEGRFDDAAARAAATITLIEDTDYLFVYRPTGIELVRALVRVGRDDEAKVVVARLEWLVEQGGPAWFRGDVSCARGLVYKDTDALLKAVTHYRDGEWQFRRARAMVDAADALKHDDRSGAAALLREAADTFDALGASWRVDGCVAALRELGVRRGVRGIRKRPPLGWEALTERELGVAHLVGEGLSNPEIAARLFISRRTVEVHLRHIFDKLELTSRSRLAAEVARRRE